MVEHRRFELLTPTLPVLCATSCANAPNNVYIITLQMICKGVKSSFFKFLQKNRISAKAVLSRWTSRLLFSYNETYFFSFIPSLQKWRIPMSKPNILWGCERTKSSSTVPSLLNGIDNESVIPDPAHTWRRFRQPACPRPGCRCCRCRRWWCGRRRWRCR